MTFKSTAASDMINVKGEMMTLRDKLDSNDPAERKKAAKRVVQIMRGGENVGELFSGMLRCVKTNDIELKRLVYLYLVTYSLQESEQSIMVVNTIIQDSQDSNPLVRALALRTMSRIHIEGVAENMIIPLKQRLDDQDPYVKKTAALAVAKLYDTVPEAIDNANVYQSLIELLTDSNPLVIANAAAAIMEINSKRTTPILKFTQANISAIANAIESSSEWCQAILFDAIAQYEPSDSQEASTMIDRLLPYLKHSNPAVVIGAFKCIFDMMDYDERLPQDLFGQIIPPFLTLVSSGEPEIQYIVLRTLTLFARKYPGALSKEVRLFFCKYNDPSYVKIQKLDIITINCAPRNAALVLDELTEYCNEIDVQFVRKTVRSIGEIALRQPSCARRCVDILVSLVEGKAEYSVEQAIIVLSDVLRKFPGQFESVIGKVCNNVDMLKDADARAALVWILGEYNAMIEKVDVILDPFLDTFADEAPQVQLQLISTIVKVFLDNPENTQDMLQFVLSEATKETVLPDVRNRALIYWRMLSLDNSLAKEFVIFGKGQVDDSGALFEPEVLDELICNMGMVSGILHILPSKFKRIVAREDEEDEGHNRQWRPANVKNVGNCPVAVNTDWDSKCFYLQITNKTEQTLTNLAVAVNVNKLGFELVEPIVFPKQLSATDSCEVAISYLFNSAKAAADGQYTLDFALRLNESVQFFSDFIDIRGIAQPKPMKKTEFLERFQQPEESLNIEIPGASLASSPELLERNIFVVAKNDHQVCLSFSLPPDLSYIADFEYSPQGVRGVVRGNPKFFDFIRESAKYAFCTD
ncbi:Adaptin N terminal region family protein [Tritrichomonas foetus]|uniref:Adaptin N terminal region family protein n=1 Tax=Tritrichomonas foetus TaxID=1144522 RepID=A0A1J4J4Y2_9EUKA|nr:Adaptin N terminal region family protein [Tritrichomonas foetus]|eukprot:OHS93207.1 Adaptin N terminal region family protein [Tritrichomonas foetus]